MNQPFSVDRVLVFTSPKAGSGAHRAEVPRLVKLLRERGLDVASTERVADLRALGSADGQVGATAVVAAGGDGTITLAASILSDVVARSEGVAGHDSDSSPPIVLVPMPLGTENLLARHYGFSADAVAMADVICGGHLKAIDLGTVSSLAPNRPRREKAMLTMATCGFDAEVVRSLHLRRKGHISRASYVGPITRSIQRYRFPEITIQAIDQRGNVQREMQCGWAMVFNLPCYGGGLSIEPAAVGDDGLFNVIAFSGRSVASGLKYVAGIKTGRHLAHRDVTRFTATRLRISAPERVHYQIDGDYVGRLPIEISMRPSAVQLLVPATGGLG